MWRNYVMVKTLYGLPSEVKFCKKCVISNQRPSSVVEFRNNIKNLKPTIQFDDYGVCSACTFKEIKDTKINWNEREKQLQDLCDRFRKTDGSFDCLVPGSGGKDSRYVSHILKYEYNMNPLTVTWAPHEYTEIGFQNMISWFQDGFSNYLITPNRKLHRYLTREAFLNLGHPFQPFIMGQKVVGPKLAKQLGIDLIFYGENQAEYGNNIQENDIPTMSEKFYTIDSSEEINDLMIGGSAVRQILEKTSFTLADFNLYVPPRTDDLEKIEMHYFGYYRYWDPQEIYYFAADKTGFRPNPERTEGTYSRYSSIDDKIDMLHYYTTYLKFGLGRASYDAAQEIRNEKISRDEGVALVKKFDAEFPNKYFQSVLEYMGIGREEFDAKCDEMRSPHLWSRSADGEWELLHKVWDVK